MKTVGWAQPTEGIFVPNNARDRRAQLSARWQWDEESGMVPADLSLNRRQPYTLIETDNASVLWHEQRAAFVTLEAKAASEIRTLLLRDSVDLSGLDARFNERRIWDLSTKLWVPFGARRYVTYFATMNITTDCNLACHYCYARGGERQESMCLATAVAVYELMIKLSGKRVRFLYHGGEPLLNFALIRDFTDCVRSKDHSGKEIAFCLQTNGVLVTEEIARYLADNQIGVGVSLDGHDNCTNQMRVKMGTNASVLAESLRGLKILQDYGLEPGVIIIVHKLNWRQLPEIIEFFVNEGIRDITVNPVIAGGRAGGKDYGISAEQYLEINLGLMHRMDEISDRIGVSITERNLRYLVRNVIYHERRYMCLRSPCGAATNLLGFTPKGDIYPCDDFSQTEKFKIANVLNGDVMESLLKSQTIQHFSCETVDRFLPCSDCPWRWVCNAGGCTARRFFASGTISAADPMCDYFKTMVPYVIAGLAEGRIHPRWYVTPDNEG